MLENNSNAAISAGAATNYNTEGNADIPPYSARLAVVKDDAANFTQTNTLWMTRLATFTTGAGSFTNFTDVREWCQFAGAGGPDTRSFFVPVMAGYNTTISLDVPVTISAFGSIAPAVDMPDSALCWAASYFSIPEDYASGLTVEAVVNPEAAGNVYSSLEASYGSCGQAYDTHTDSVAYSATAISTGTYNCVNSTSLSSAAVSDIVTLRYFRNATDALDTVGATVEALGFFVEYTPIS